MRILWAALATAPFVAVAVGMLTGRVRARACCALPAEDDVRLRQPSTGTANKSTGQSQKP